jgi:D-proline reductase (dithiol) PrdB
MATFSDLSLRHRLFMKTYRYRSYDWFPGARMRVPLHRANLAIVSTAAFYLPEQEPFDQKLKGGDYSYRELKREVQLDRLEIGHRSSAFDPSGIQKDKNLALPLDRLEEMLRKGVIGDINHRHFSFMGAITAPGRLMTRSGPEVARLLLDDRVDAVLLTPV